MSSQNTTTGGKKAEILSAALELFLENGYEKTSVRMIAQKIGCEVGLVYYYFKTKETLFEEALSLHFANIEEDLRAFSGAQEPSIEKILENFADHAKKTAETFRISFPESVHFTIRAAVREKTISLCEKYLVKAIEEADTKNTLVTPVFFARAICGAAFYDSDEDFDANKAKLLQMAKTLIGKESTGKKRDIPSFLL